MKRVLLAIALTMPVAALGQQPTQPAPPAQPAETPAQQALAKQAQPLLQDIARATAELQLLQRIDKDNEALQPLQQQYEAAAAKSEPAKPAAKK